MSSDSVVWWRCLGCNLQARISDDTGDEPQRLWQILRDLHAPYCRGALSTGGWSTDASA